MSALARGLPITRLAGFEPAKSLHQIKGLAVRPQQNKPATPAPKPLTPAPGISGASLPEGVR
jgi:hypothetical protein